MKLIFEAKKDEISGIIEIVKLVKIAALKVVATCTDGTIVTFWIDTEYLFAEEVYQSAEDFDKMCEDAYSDLVNCGVTKLIVDCCSFSEHSDDEEQ